MSQTKLKKGIRDFLKLNENKHTVYPVFWDIIKEVLRGMNLFIPLSAQIKEKTWKDILLAT